MGAPAPTRQKEPHMNLHDPYALDRQAKALRHEELARLAGEAACALRKAWSRLWHRPAPACAPLPARG
jgi:hypothetical protein